MFMHPPAVTRVCLQASHNTHFFIHSFTYTYVFIVHAGVRQSCQPQRPAAEEEEEVEEEACAMPCCDWPLPYQRGRARSETGKGGARLIIKAL